MESKIREHLAKQPWSCKSVTPEMWEYLTSNYRTVDSEDKHGRKWYMLYMEGNDSKYGHWMFCLDTKEKRPDTASEFYHHTDFDYRKFVTKKGTTVRCIYIDDVEPNAGGYFVEVYRDDDELLGDKLDDFCIHPTDCDCSNWDAVVGEASKYIQSVNEY